MGPIINETGLKIRTNPDNELRRENVNLITALSCSVFLYANTRNFKEMTHPEWVSLETGPGCHSQLRQSWFLLTDKVIMADSPCPKEEMVVTVTNA